MKAFEIKVVVDEVYYKDIDENIEEFLGDDEMEDEVVYWQDVAATLKSLEGTHIVTTFEEYYNLMDKISKYSDDYRVYNCGTTIEIR